VRGAPNNGTIYIVAYFYGFFKGAPVSRPGKPRCARTLPVGKQSPHQHDVKDAGSRAAESITGKRLQKIGPRASYVSAALLAMPTGVWATALR
jgi:hypothetical protein